MKSICIYGKGGIGKSTCASNIACAMAASGKRVLFIGCDPKADSTRNVCGRKIKPLLRKIYDNDELRIEDIVTTGRFNVDCVEIGGPKPGDGCAGRGIVTAVSRLKSMNILDSGKYDVVIYDVLGDVVCGGFSMPIKDGFADFVYIVTTCDSMALYAANNICACIEKYACRGRAKLGGILYNERGVVRQQKIAEAFAEKIGTHIAGVIPLSTQIAKAELKKLPLLSFAPESEAAACFKNIAEKISAEEKGAIPRAMDEETFESFLESMEEYYDKASMF